jgi:2-dehydro-3-deoxyphosphooctonate aldolase (KDO 8-P synthase)
MGDLSDGQREFVPHFVRGVVACSINILFMRAYDDPPNALSDAHPTPGTKYFECVLSQAKQADKMGLEALDRWGENCVHINN